MGEMIQKNKYDELKDKYDELKQLCLTLQREKNLFEESYGDVSARLVEAQQDRDMYKDLYNGLNVKNGKLQKMYDNANEARDKFITENTKLKDDFAHCSKLLKEMEANYDEASDRNAILVKEVDKFISENAKLKEDYNKLVDENKELTETLDKLRTKPDHYILKDKIKCATPEEVQEFNNIIRQALVKLDPVLSETPSVVINAKSINITFDNHTNNFKEDDIND